MEEAVVGAVVGASIQVLLQNLLTISLEQINLFLSCKNDLETLKTAFVMVKDFLDDAETRQVTDNAVKRWLWELEALAFDADNVFDDINYQLLSNKVETTQKQLIKKKVQSFLSISNNPIAYRLNLGRRIKDIIERLEYINQRACEFGLQTRIAIAQAPFYIYGSNASGSMETDSFTVDPFFYGRKDDVERIVGMLITTPSPAAEQVLSVLPIVGMGGLGKTTLARKVFNDGKIKVHFNTLVWVHVPRVFDVLILLKNILTSLTTENVEHGNREAILKNLQTHLGAKKYLLILDDVWNEDGEKWDDFVKSLSGISSATGNCMVVTTRSQEVGSIVGTLPVHKLNGLSEDDCWSIIKAKAFRGGDSPLEFETIGINIAKRCKGLPLAAKVFGGLLFGKSKNEWLVIEKKPLSNFGDGDHVYKILKLSFDSLSSPSLKKCFAYCSIFPKGYEIEKEQLVELWMAEGFLQSIDGRNNNNMETTGSDFLNILVHHCLLQVAKRDSNGNVTLCNMHDLVHDLSYSILHENDKDTSAVFQSRYIGWKPSGDGLLFIPQGQEKYVRTLFFDGEISDINFSDLESLHSLTLMGDHINELPTSIKELKHLRYLDISESGIRYLPESIDELYHMQTLRTKKKWGRCYLEKLPDSLNNSINLRHLHISKFTVLPPGIGKLTSLQTLPFFHVDGEKGCGISEMKHLKDLKGKVEISNLEKVRGKCEAASADLLQKQGIYELRVVWDPSRCREVDHEEANDDENVLEGLQPHPNLKSLSIYGFKGKSFPQWTLKMAVQWLDGRCCCWEGLDNLMEIKLEYCIQVEQLPALGHLPHLKSLYLCGLTKVRSIGSSFYNIEDCSKSRTSPNIMNGVVVVFGALERLELLEMPSLVEWAGVDDCPRPHDQLDHVYFPKLKYLKVEGCTQLTSAPSHDFPRLETLDVSGMNSSLPLESICGMKSTSLKSLNIRGIQGLECLPDDLHRLNALEEFHISSCKSLKSIPYGGQQQQQQQGFTSLRKLWIRNCKRLTSLPIEMVESCAPSLEELTLCELSSITNIPMVVECLYRMPRLRALAISGVPKFSGGLSTIDGLQTLHMGPFSDSSDNVSLNEVVDDMLLQNTSVCKLILSGIEHWECLPYQIQHLTSLRVLYLWNYGIESLPEWFENLSSLEVLTVNSFKKLRHLPSKLAMLRLSKLKFLDIIRCPLLLSNNNHDGGDIVDEMIVESEWSKISHIHYITVDKTQNY